MYTATPQPTNFFYQPSTFYHQAGANVQPRVENDRMLMSPSRYAYSFRTPGWILGACILFFTCALVATELGRLYSGSNNRGNGEVNSTGEYLMYPNNYLGFNQSPWNVKVENRWMWPWSTATLLFSLLFFTTGLFGIISGQRENYPTILTFFILALVSFCLLIFLIASYSTIIAGWRSIYGTGDGNRMSRYDRIDRDLAIVCLSVCCVLLILNFLSLIAAGRTIDLGEGKDFYHGEKLSEPSFSPPLTPRIGY